MPPVKLADFFFEVTQAGGGAAQAVVGADDGNVVPHQAADLVPVVIDDDELVGFRNIAVVPLGDWWRVHRGLVGRVETHHFRKCEAAYYVAFE